MKIRIKLKHTQLVSLVSLMENIINTDECETRCDAIVTILVLKMYKKLKEKTVMMEPKNYTFSIDPETAMAFIEFFSCIPFDKYSHGGNVADRMIQDFDKQTAHFISSRRH